MGSTVTARLSVPVFGVVQGDVTMQDGATWSQPELEADTEKSAAAPAPETVRAAQGGAVILVADRKVAQELLVTCPPLLEIFAGA